MEGNKDEALRCIERAEEYISKGNKDQAIKFLYKAEKLYTTQKAKDLIEKLNTAEGPAPSASNVRHRARTPENKGNARQPNRAAAEYTSDQLKQIKRIKGCKDYYEILGVTKEATDVEIKKSYKKLALQLHPDKNKAPGSAEAFKAVGNAVAILTDSEKRSRYDMYGSSEEKVTQQTRHSYEYTRGFEADMSAEELFNVFFGTGFTNQNHVFMRRGGGFWHRQGEEDQQPPNGSAVFFQLLPILILILLSMLSGLFVSDPVYSLVPNPKYPMLRNTARFKIPYYVKDNFASTYEGSIQRLETNVEEDYLQHIKQDCYKEQHTKEANIWRARHFGDRNLLQKARDIRTPSCDEYTKFMNYQPA